MPVTRSTFLPYKSYCCKWHCHENIRTLAKNTWCVDTIFIDSSIDCFLNHVSMVMMAQVLQHVNSCIQHGNRVGNVLPCNCCSCIACAWFKYGVLCRKINCLHTWGERSFGFMTGTQNNIKNWSLFNQSSCQYDFQCLFWDYIELNIPLSNYLIVCQYIVLFLISEQFIQYSLKKHCMLFTKSQKCNINMLLNTLQKPWIKNVVLIMLPLHEYFT